MRYDRLRYRVFASGKVSVFKFGPRWTIVDPSRPVGDSTKRCRSYAEAITAAHPARWASAYEPDYRAVEHPPIATIQALLQAAWA